MHDLLDFSGNVVLVTGGTKGIGRSIVERFAAAGATVVTCARSARSDGLPPGVEIVAADLRDPDEVTRLVARVREQTGRLDVLVNNAGGSGVSGLRPSPATAAYGAAKAGLINLTETLAVEWAPKVRVNTVTPGYIETEQAPLFYGDKAGIARVAATVPMGRLGSPSDVADACLFMASPLASYVSGANLVVHGGGEAPRYLSAPAGNEPE